jgi:hypothetical protein
MILEGIMTTLDAAGEVSISPMGPIVDEAMRELVLRPFKTSRTYVNLKAHGEGVFHVTDDVWLLARAAVSKVDVETVPTRTVRGRVLAGACRAYEFRVIDVDDADERTFLQAEVVATHRMRDFFGFNRAKHAVVEAAILATRTALLDRTEILAEFERLAILVEKTGGDAEHKAFDFLRNYVEHAPSPDKTE